MTDKTRAEELAALIPSLGVDAWSIGKLHEAAAELRRLAAEVDALRADAERYRHMRNNAQFRDRNGPGLYWYLPRFGSGDSAERLDAAIDSARKEQA